MTVTLERGRRTEVQGYLVLYTSSERATGAQARRQQVLATVLFSYKNTVRPEILVRPWPGLPGQLRGPDD